MDLKIKYNQNQTILDCVGLFVERQQRISSTMDACCGGLTMPIDAQWYSSHNWRTQLIGCTESERRRSVAHALYSVPGRITWCRRTLSFSNGGSCLE